MILSYSRSRTRFLTEIVRARSRTSEFVSRTVASNGDKSTRKVAAVCSNRETRKMRIESGNSELWLIRHGETEWSASGAHTSRTDVPLTDRGKHSGKAVGDWLAGTEFSLVLTSSRQRARETCRIAGYSAVAHTESSPRCDVVACGKGDGLRMGLWGS